VWSVSNSATGFDGGDVMDVVKERVVRILYTNYKGETAYRNIVPDKIWFGATDWHKEPQWLLDAFDLEKEAVRNFALKDIQKWSAAPLG
jgi:predicted DNA-binding transcriptional regulator YafY